MRFKFFHIILVLVLSLIVNACGDAELPSVSDLPISDLPIELPNLPGIPSTLGEIPGLLEELGVPDLGEVTNLPQLEDLPFLGDEPGTITFQGPTERGIGVGERIPGTDIELVNIADNNAEFRIAGLRSVRTHGDSLDFDGPWPGASDITYSVRLRIYHVGSNRVRAAGVQQLKIPNIQPVEGSVALNGRVMKFPYTTSAGLGETFKGLTYGYTRADERGAEISGLPSGDYPYRKIGDSIRWEGNLRPGMSITHNIRVLFYNESSVRVGGVVNISLPE